MVRHYAPKTRGFPHARKPREFYEKLVMASIFRHNPRRIADYLGVPIQTVERNLARLRKTLSTSGTFWHRIGNRIHAIAVVDVYPSNAFLEIAQDLAEGRYPGKTCEDFRICIQDCPRALNFRHIYKNDIRLTELFNENDELIPNRNLPYLYYDRVDNRPLAKSWKRRKDCLRCPLGVSRSEVLGLMVEADTAFEDIIIHFAKHRVQHDAFEHIHYAVALGIIQFYIAHYSRKLQSEGCSDEECGRLMDPIIRDLVRDIIDSMADQA